MTTSSARLPLLATPPSPTDVLSLVARESASSRNEAREKIYVSRRRHCWWVALFSSIFVCVVLPIIIDFLIVSGVEEQVFLTSPSSSGYPQFMNRSSQGGTRNMYYFFDIQNSHEILKGAKPRVKEIGPFIYNVVQTRHDVSWDAEHDTVQFRTQTRQVFDAEATRAATNGTYDSDLVVITSPNVLFWGMRAQVGPISWHTLLASAKLGSPWPTDHERLFKVGPIRDLMFGYRVHVAGFAPVVFPGYFPTYETPESDPEYVHPTVMAVGKKNKTRAHELVEWGKTRTHAETWCPYGHNPAEKWCPGATPCCGEDSVRPWGREILPDDWNPDANSIHGTLGDAFYPWIKRGDDTKLIVFSNMLRRAMRFHNRDGELTTLQGIELLRFRPMAEFFQNATENPANRRYHQFGPSGLVNASVVNAGAPVYASMPHFIGCDPALLDGVDGLNPDLEKHDFFLDIEAHIGQTFREHLRIMLSAGVEGQQGSWFREMPARTQYIPIMWLDAHSEISELGITNFLALYNGLSLLWGAVALGFIGFVLTAFGPRTYGFFALHHRKRMSVRNLRRSLSGSGGLPSASPSLSSSSRSLRENSSDLARVAHDEEAAAAGLLLSWPSGADAVASVEAD